MISFGEKECRSRVPLMGTLTISSLIKWVLREKPVLRFSDYDFLNVFCVRFFGILPQRIRHLPYGLFLDFYRGRFSGLSLIGTALFMRGNVELRDFARRE
jgi:hypothetical protein